MVASENQEGIEWSRRGTLQGKRVPCAPGKPHLTLAHKGQKPVITSYRVFSCLMVCLGLAWLIGFVTQSWLGLVGLVLAWLVLAWFGLASLGLASVGLAWLGFARLGSASLVLSSLGLVWLGFLASSVLAWLGLASLGFASLGLASLVLARLR